MSYPKRALGSQEKQALRQQEINNKKDQVKNLLINKFRNKIGVVPDGGPLDLLVKNEVGAFLAVEQPTEANLIKLDKRLQYLMKEQGLNGNTKASQHTRSRSIRSNVPNEVPAGKASRRSERSQISNRSFASVGSQVVKERQNQQSNGMVIDQVPDSPAKDPWNALIKIDLDKFEKEKRQAADKEKERREKMKRELEEQVKQRQRAKQENKQQELLFSKKQREMAELERMQEDKKREIERQKIKDEQLIRQQQLNATKKKKDQEKQLDLQADYQIKIRMKQEAENEKVLEKKKIESYKELCKKQFEDNQRMKQIKREQEELQGQNQGTGKDLMGQLFERKEHQSYARQKEQERRLEALKPQLLGGAGANRQRQQDQAQEIYLKQKLDFEAEQDRRRKDLIKQKEQETKNYLSMQINMKKTQEKQHKVEDVEQARKILSDVERFQTEEQKKSEEHKKMLRQHQNQLQGQIGSKTKNAIPMVKNEYLLNKRLLSPS